MNWKALEDAWVVAAVGAIERVADAHREERLYAACFWLFYGDYATIGIPAFAINTEAHLLEQDEQTSYANRWIPPSWRWDAVDGVTESVRPAYAALSKVDEEEFESLFAAHFATIARVCRRVTAEADDGRLKGAGLPRDFLTVILHDRDGPAFCESLVRASVHGDVLKEHPDLVAWCSAATLE